MKAISFFSLLNELYRLDAQEKLSQIGIISVPHMKTENAKEIINSYKQASSDIMEVLKDNNDYSSINLLKAELNGNNRSN